MIDKFIAFVKTGIYTLAEESPIDNIKSEKTHIKLELSRDQFKYFCKDINKNKFKYDIEATIYDEGVIKSYYDILPIKSLLTQLNKQSIKNIKFILSDSTLPIYNNIMHTIGWKHKNKTTIKMTIDRNPTSIEIRDWKLSKAVGTIDIPEEKLIWISDNELCKLKNIINEKTLQNIVKLKDLIFFLDNYLRKKYYIEKMNDYEKVYAIFNFLKTYIKNTNDMKTIQTNDIYQIWKQKEGTFEQQAKLLLILLNNPIINIDACMLEGTILESKNKWLGIVIKNKLYELCPRIENPLSNLKHLGYEIQNDSNNTQIYPTIYTQSYLDEEEIYNIKNNIKKLKR